MASHTKRNFAQSNALTVTQTFLIPERFWNFLRPLVWVFFCLSVLVVLAGCSGGGSSPLSITTSSLPSGTVGTAYSQTLAVTGGKTPYTWSISSGSLPAGLSLAASTGAISGTPTTAGASNFTIGVKDSSNPAQSKSANLSITIAAAPALSITTSSLPSGTVGVAYSQTLAATGGMTPYTWSISSGALPSGLSLAASTGAITGTPTIAGKSSFSIKATDSSSPVQSQTANLSITINSATPALAITTSSLPNGTVSAAYTQALAATGGTTPYTWSISSGTLPAGLTLNASTGAVSGTPTTAGTSNFTVKVTDSSSPAQSQTANLSITIASATTPLAITTSSLPSGTVSAAYSQTLVATGGKTPYTWSISIGALPAGLALNASTGAITGTPTTAGTSSFTVKVTDSSTPAQSQTANLSIVIASATPPLAITTSSLPNGSAGTAYSGILAATGGKTPYTWSISSGTLPAGLTLNASTGAITGTPTTAGTSDFSVKVTDSSTPAQSQTANLAITISSTGGALAIDTVTLPPAYVGTAYDYVFQVAGGTQPYSWTWTGTLPPGLSFNQTTGTLSGTPTAAGVALLTFTVTSADSQSARLGYALQVFTGNGSNDTFLKGRYAFALQSTNYLNSANASVASFQADGAGNILAGVEDGGSVSTFVGTYNVGSDNRGSMTIYPDPASQKSGTTLVAEAFTFALGTPQSGVGTSGQIVRTGSGNPLNSTPHATSLAAASGQLLLQDPASFTLTALHGNYAFAGLFGVMNGQSTETMAGVLSLNGSGVVANTSEFDFTQAGVGLINTTVSGTIGAPDTTTGRATAALTPADGQQFFTSGAVVYVVNSQKFFIYTLPAGGVPGIGTAKLQNASITYDSTALNSIAIFYSGSLNACNSSGVCDSLAEIGTLNFATAGSYNEVADTNTAGVITQNVPSTGTVTVAANGRVLGDGGGWIAYLTDRNQGFLLGPDSHFELGWMAAQSGSPFSTASISGSYAGANSSAFVPASNLFSGVANSPSAGSLNLTQDVTPASGSGTTLDQTSTLTFSVDATTGRISFNDNFVGYAISPAEFFILDENTSTTSPVVAIWQK